VPGGRRLPASRSVEPAVPHHKGSDLAFRDPYPGRVAVLVPTRVWAHRGARRQAPENTRAAFARAVELGADGVELDARHTADGVVVVSHDPVVRDFGVLAERSFAELRAARADVATLDEALDACAGVLVNVELKCLPGEVDYDPGDRLVGLVADTLAERGRRDDVLVSSFNLEALNRARTRDPGTPTALLTLSGFDPDAALALVVDGGHAALHPHLRALHGGRAAAVAGRAHERGVRVNVWTVNGAARVRRLSGAGIDAVITDEPDRALAALGR
jgi:glycerophosphoryl diester phosphodiesterase